MTVTDYLLANNKTYASQFSGPLARRLTREVLARSQQAFDQEGAFNQVAAIVIRSEVWNHLAGAAVEKVRPDAMEAIRF